ncbi:aminotransferase [Thecamonas trahens ATCC 50062]|uniref:Aminotransferase n=1 Tax=Thecamonas trahens ATCC 50062 TaxID=461836 RepID=A0A0L0DV51_THETB|nr:aminotransferase [Thecamonas trahens ATCC 50062]KNC56085.1 aminotransferase [Thecamonas trahens ATCC 50062]|eukprot:XP_013761127.1 aminotransferase [Thecamonas trahens ATCC 50062]
MIPGPIEVDDAVLEASAGQAWSHVQPQIIEAYAEALALFKAATLGEAADNQPFIVSGSGTLAMEMAAANVLQPSSRALVASTGYFGDRMADIARRTGASVDVLAVDRPGETVDLSALEAKLVDAAAAGAAPDAVFITHVDTSTGVVVDVAAAAATVHRVVPDALVVADGVCAAAGDEMRMDEWGVDIYLTASQKALGLPPGLALLNVSPRALAAHAARDAPVTTYYGDWANWLPIMQAYAARSPAYFATPATGLVMALRTSLDAMVNAPGGMDARFAAHRAASDAVKDLVQSELGLQLVPTSRDHAAATMTAAYYPSDASPPAFLSDMLDAGVIVAGGLHPAIKDSYFRMGHMGVSPLGSAALASPLSPRSALDAPDSTAASHIGFNSPASADSDIAYALPPSAADGLASVAAVAAYVSPADVHDPLSHALAPTAAADGPDVDDPAAGKALVARDWNAEFQAIVEWQPATLSQSKLRLQKLCRLTDAFRAEVLAAVATIVDERALPPGTPRTIEPAANYIHNGIFYKFALDVHGLYGGDDGVAMKVASLEMTFLLTCMAEEVPGIAFPLMAVVDYKGFRLSAMSLLPISDSSLVYGSDDGGQSVHDDVDALHAPLNNLASRLNLAPHVVGMYAASAATIPFPGDLEVHTGADGRYYLIDTARLMPPMPPKAFPGVRGSFLFNLFRPEFVRHYSVPLCSDAYTNWIRADPDAASYGAACDAAFEHLLTTTIPSCLEQLKSDVGIANVTPSILAFNLGAKGINIALLGHVLSALDLSVADDCVLANAILHDMVVRLLKARLRRVWRTCSPAALAEATAAFDAVVSGANADAATTLWTSLLASDMAARWPGDWSSWPQLAAGTDLRRSAADGKADGLGVDPDAVLRDVKAAVGLRDDGAFEPQARMMSYAAVLEASDAYDEAIEEIRIGNVAGADAPMDKASKMFAEAIESQPNARGIYRTWSRDLLRLAFEAMVLHPAAAASYTIHAWSRAAKVLELDDFCATAVEVAVDLANLGMIKACLAAVIIRGGQSLETVVAGIAKDAGIKLANGTTITAEALVETAFNHFARARELGPTLMTVKTSKAISLRHLAEARMVATGDHAAHVADLRLAALELDMVVTAERDTMGTVDALALAGSLHASIASSLQMGSALASEVLSHAQRALDILRRAAAVDADAELVRLNLANTLLLVATVSGDGSPATIAALRECLTVSREAARLSVKNTPAALVRLASVLRNTASSFPPGPEARAAVAEALELLRPLKKRMPESADVAAEMLGCLVVAASLWTNARLKGGIIGTWTESDLRDAAAHSAAVQAALEDLDATLASARARGMSLTPGLDKQVIYLRIKSAGVLVQLAPPGQGLELLASFAPAMEAMASEPTRIRVHALSMIVGVASDCVVGGVSSGPSAAALLAAASRAVASLMSVPAAVGLADALEACFDGETEQSVVAFAAALESLPCAELDTENINCAHVTESIRFLITGASGVIKASDGTAAAVGTAAVGGVVDAGLALIDAACEFATVAAVGAGGAAALQVVGSRLATDYMRAASADPSVGAAGAERYTEAGIVLASKALELTPAAATALAARIVAGRLHAQALAAGGKVAEAISARQAAVDIGNAGVAAAITTGVPASSELLANAALCEFESISQGPGGLGGPGQLPGLVRAAERLEAAMRADGSQWGRNVSVVATAATIRRVLAELDPDMAGKGVHLGAGLAWAERALDLDGSCADAVAELGLLARMTGQAERMQSALAQLSAWVAGSGGGVPPVRVALGMAKLRVALAKAVPAQGSEMLAAADADFVKALQASGGASEYALAIMMGRIEVAFTLSLMTGEPQHLATTAALLDAGLASFGAGTPEEAQLLATWINVAANGVLTMPGEAGKYAQLLAKHSAAVVERHSNNLGALLEATGKCLGIAQRAPQLMASLFPIAAAAAAAAVNVSGGESLQAMQAYGGCMYQQALSTPAPSSAELWRSAIPIFRKTLSLVPHPRAAATNDVERLFTAHMQIGEYDEALPLIAASYPYEPKFAYNYACCLVAAGDVETARAVLDEGAQRGVHPPRAHVEADNDLAPLREDASWWASFLAKLS